MADPRSTTDLDATAQAELVRRGDASPSELVDAALATVSRVLVEGIILVVVILFLFLGDIRSIVVVIATLVLTPLMTFTVMNRLGIPANLM